MFTALNWLLLLFILTKIGLKEKTANLSACTRGWESVGFSFSISHVCSFKYSQLIPFNGVTTYGEAAAG